MWKRYQEYFKEDRYKFLLKYDGVRSKNLYTVRIYDKNDSDNVYGKDTDNPSDDFKLILDKVGINLSSDDNVMYSDFLRALNLVIPKFGNEVILVFLIDKHDKVLINFDLIYNSQSFSCQNNTIDELIAYIHGMGS